ncbi:hypothetical protein BKA59DRAFT_497268 [Fusarium tricinctum]|uniref:Major facilitator superfamily transporter n=1 Tax=Fusarium tricinctum TaxID=61284 RepID=A0A8K0RKK1_9HYPO|nr:hypothetical protein BKA59DRAFT_497268 [Fusarium tricinctum]
MTSTTANLGEKSVYNDEPQPAVYPPADAETTKKSNPLAGFETDVVHPNRTADIEVGQQEEDGYLHGLPLVLMTLSLMVGVLMISLDNSIIATAIPKITSKFDSLGDAWLGAAGIFCGAMFIISRIVEVRKRPLLLAIVSSITALDALMALIICLYYPLSLGEAPDGKQTLKEKILGLGLKSAVILAGTLVCCLLGFGLLLTVFVIIQIRQKEKALTRPQIISQRSVLLGCIFSALYQGAMTTQTYHLPFYFQAVKGVDPQTSGIDILPHGLTITIKTLIVGSVVTWLGYYVPFMWVGSAVFTTGAGLLHTLTEETSMAKWFGYEIPIFAVQVVLDVADITLGTVLIILSQALGGSIGLSISQNVFQNSLHQRLDEIAGIDVKAHIVSAESLSYVRDAFRYGVSNAFLVSTSLGGVAFLASIWMERKKIKSKKEEGE